MDHDWTMDEWMNREHERVANLAPEDLAYQAHVELKKVVANLRPVFEVWGSATMAAQRVMAEKGLKDLMEIQKRFGCTLFDFLQEEKLDPYTGFTLGLVWMYFMMESVLVPLAARQSPWDEVDFPWDKSDGPEGGGEEDDIPGK